MENKTVIIDGARSPMGMKNGKMIGLRPEDLGAKTLNALLESNSHIDFENIELVKL